MVYLNCHTKNFCGTKLTKSEMLCKEKYFNFYRRNKYIINFFSTYTNERFFSSRSKDETPSIRGPSTPTHSWQRAAKLVKNTDVSNQYLEHIRQVHADPSLQLKTIEDELKGTIGKALGKQGAKIIQFLVQMEKEQAKYTELLSSSLSSSSNESENQLDRETLKELRKCAIRHNECRKLAEKARWELIVHRQAVGFIVSNHKICTETFPIGDPLPLREIDEEENESQENIKNNEKKKFTDQLDWWERIGRWR